MLLKQLSDHVWIWPCSSADDVLWPNIGIIVGQSETVLIDAGNGPPMAREILVALDEITAPPVGRIVYTHHHWDHVFGASVFDAPVVANIRSVPFLERKAVTAWSVEYLEGVATPPTSPRGQAVSTYQQQVDHQLQAVEDWSALQIVLPSVTFDQTHTLRLDGLTIELTHVGGIHAPDSIVAHVVEEGVMFVGDSFYAPPVYELQPGQEDKIMLDVIDKFWRGDVQLYVDGHSKPYSSRQMQLLIRWQKMVQAARK